MAQMIWLDLGSTKVYFRPDVRCSIAVASKLFGDLHILYSAILYALHTDSVARSHHDMTHIVSGMGMTLDSVEGGCHRAVHCHAHHLMYMS